MSIKSKIDCPECGMPIFFESTLLLGGHAFPCSNPECGVSLALTGTDKEVVSNAFNKFEQIRHSAGAHSEQHDV